MNILLVSSYFRPHVGGVERFTELLARGLAARGHGVTVACCRTDRDLPEAEELDGYTVRRVAATNVLERRVGVPYPLPLPASSHALRRLVDEADVVHAQEGRWLLSAAALRRAAGSRVPAVLTQHTAFVPQRNGALDAAQRSLARIVRRSARTAGAVTVYNPEVAAWVARVWGIEGAEVLPVGVAGPEPAPDRAELGLPDDRFLVLFVGRGVHTKGFDLVTAAVDPAYELIAVTDAPVESRPGLRVLGFMEAEHLGRLMSSADAFLLPSRGEGFPLSMQEAMCAGLPVVTTMLPGYERFLGENDVLVVPTEAGAIRAALRRLAQDPELHARLAARSVEVSARHFSEGRFVDAYEELYRRLVPGR